MDSNMTKIDLPNRIEATALSALLARAVETPGFFGNTETVGGKLSLIDFILTRSGIQEGDDSLQLAGALLGEVLILAKGMQWYMMEKSGVRLPCVGLTGTPIKIFPFKFFSDHATAGTLPSAREAFDYLCQGIDETREALKDVIAARNGSAT